MSINTALDSQFDSKSGEAAVFARGVLHPGNHRSLGTPALNGMDAAGRGQVINRTHRVVRQRAKMMQARRTYVRSLTVPLIVCSALLILTVLAVWSGLYQYQASEAADALQDMASAAYNQASNHILVVLLWFVPVSLTVLAAVWLTRSRRADTETIR